MTLTSQQIKERLHRFNLTNDWSVFDDVPSDQHVSVMYPHVIHMPGTTDEQRKAKLVELFGPLPE